MTAPLLRQGRYPRFKVGRAISGPEGAGPDGVRVQTYFVRTGPWAWLEPRLANGMVDYIGPQDRAAYGSKSIGAIVDVDADNGAQTGHVVLITAEGFDNLSFQFNGDFALNLFNWMTEREALISIRGKRYLSHRLELAPQQVDRIGWLLIAGVPGVLLLLGLFVMYRRSRT